MLERALLGVTASVAGSLGHSLGMTLQKRAHMRLERLDDVDRLNGRSSSGQGRAQAWRSREWQVGLGLYLFSSTVPPTIALSILPVFVAAPLAAVGLVANAVFAKYILASTFVQTDALGTLLVSLGSCCVAVFGAIDEPLLSLDELLQLYTRPAYVIFFLLYSALVATLIAAEIYWRRRFAGLLADTRAPIGPLSGCPESGAAVARRVALFPVSSAAKKPANGGFGTFAEHSPLLSPVSSDASSGYSSVLESLSPEPAISSAAPRIQTPNDCNNNTLCMIQASTEAVDNMYRRHFSEANECLSTTHEAKTSRRAGQVAQYVSGLLSAVVSGLLCSQTLLLAKSGIGLLVLTIQGNMQLRDPLALAIAAGLVTTALANLYYIQRALRLCSTLTVVPLSYCSSSLSALMSSLVYFDQVHLMTTMQISMISVGIVLLAAGVGLLSSKADAQEGPLHLPAQCPED
ncbi:hypothetical protein H4R26_000004 [Coemansia thaxteri]|uniref:Magnesium transporter n=1 Tax=Coemansia thaxteri TaxID=2663907 RepID=A0A9W8BPH9_9FUNG|nr:hypothetical protein H4R26_000004 [Coemansia thaxteri]KAJ2485633.1 hypothetical protein EV174_001607 [Coemansia sp. RSA 2320]